MGTTALLWSLCWFPSLPLFPALFCFLLDWTVAWLENSPLCSSEPNWLEAFHWDTASYKQGMFFWTDRSSSCQCMSGRNYGCIPEPQGWWRAQSTQGSSNLLLKMKPGKPFLSMYVFSFFKICPSLVEVSGVSVRVIFTFSQVDKTSVV